LPIRQVRPVQVECDVPSRPLSSSAPDITTEQVAILELLDEVRALRGTVNALRDRVRILETWRRT